MEVDCLAGEADWIVSASSWLHCYSPKVPTDPIEYYPRPTQSFLVVDENGEDETGVTPAAAAAAGMAVAARSSWDS